MYSNQKAVALFFFAALLCGCNSDQTSGPAPQLPDGPVSKAKPNPQRLDPIDLTEPFLSRRGFAEPAIIDTTKFEPQIKYQEPFQGEVRSSSVLRPEKNGLPELPAGEPNDLEPVQNVQVQRVVPHSQFPAIDQTQWTPPDPSIAVGPNHIVETVNQSIAFFTKDGQLLFQQRLNDTEQPGFFDEIGSGDFVFDPKCFYDHFANRFFVVAPEVYRDIDEAYITFAISDDDDPNGVWYKYRTNAVIQVESAEYWVDYPGLGFDANGVYVTGNLFRLAGDGPGFANSLFRSIDKSTILDGGTAQFVDIRNPSANSVQVAQIFGDNPTPLFVSRNTSTRLRIIALMDPLGTPSFETEFVDVPEYFSPPSVPNGSFSNFISALDGRIINVHWRDGRLWTCHGISNATFDGAVARWYEIETGSWPNGPVPQLIQTGEVTDGDGVSTFFPAIYSDVNNNAALVMARSSASDFASVAATGRLEVDPLGVMGEVQTLEVGSESADGRWGDYFDIALDPDGTTFWMVGQIRESFGWRTTINSFSLFVLGDVNGDGVVDLEDIAPFVELLTTGAFNAAADINGDGAVTLEDIPLFVNLLSD